MPPKPCMMCGNPAREKTDFCADCFKKLEDRYLPEEEAAPPPARDWRWVAWVFAAAALIVTAVRMPRVAGAFASPRPLRQGPADTDRTTDQCIRRLWTASRLIQEGRWPSPELSCPASARPYESRGRAPSLSVHCPTPKAHRMSDVSVGKGRPVPEARR